VFVTSQGHPRAEFQRAIERGNLLQAKALAKIIAHSTGKLALGDALILLYLMAAKRDPNYEKAALRWLARFVQEIPAVTMEEAQLALAALATLDRLPKDGGASGAVSAARDHPAASRVRLIVWPYTHLAQPNRPEHRPACTGLP
jgi:hypothetical protein